MMKAFIQEKLDTLKQNSLKRDLRVVRGSQGREIIISGKKVLNFCSNNYLGLADDPRLSRAVSRCIRQEGFGSGASRLVCGNMFAHQQLEKEIARFKKSESCLLFSTGYMANVGIISAMFKRGDVIFSDRLNHSSIIDGIILSRSTLKRYPHNDMQALEVALSSATGFKKRCIVTDSVFSMDGDSAPLDKIVDLARRYDCSVMIDEAHALGILGRNGKPDKMRFKGAAGMRAGRAGTGRHLFSEQTTVDDRRFRHHGNTRNYHYYLCHKFSAGS